ncbi:three-Cys-motif partner protein TcmP [Nostoc sp. FACHB-888]|uniref:three-Cys-motif partner protein TcmP n=1 Tax=Nostoc sp. FACHB-888 TaxID=2692842 RepID=UPI0016856960|nr:three-Cys-motif partner protein TcmP [Nostoc sp. FACHB-888]MBD2247523.1 three-Cys-motif partner protein TcmP [Nostoc sp. FACHB-888]
MNKQTFGGNWTEEKLNRIRKYLPAYTTILKEYNFKYAYIDAFAGTGYRTLKDTEEQNQLLLPELIDQESQQFMDGSARIALQVEPRFNKYIFIEKDINKIPHLEQLKVEFLDKNQDIKIINDDANNYLKTLCDKNWRANRAVLFLDPFGMQIPWSTIEAIAHTEAIDLWYLFPLGVAINRLLTRDGNIKESLKKRLDETFGTTDWFDSFYTTTRQLSLFENSPQREKTVDCEAIGRYFVKRLETIFAGVAENPLVLRNSRNSPLYLLCFASANPKGSKTAIKIAQHILKA